MITLFVIFNILAIVLWRKRMSRAKKGELDINPLNEEPNFIAVMMLITTLLSVIGWLGICLTYLP
jgi:hypothetical protein